MRPRKKNSTEANEVNEGGWEKDPADSDFAEKLPVFTNYSNCIKDR
jgi:hypothetical protein